MKTKPQTRYLFAGGCALVMLGLAAWHYQTRPSPAAVTKVTPIKTSQQDKTASVIPATSGSHQPVAEAASPKTRKKLIDARGVIHADGKQQYQFQIEYLVETQRFAMSDEELGRAQKAYESMYISRQRLEAEVARVEKVDALHFKIIIPAYPTAGENLKLIFETDLIGILGEERARQFLGKTGLNLAMVNGGWGAADQVLDIKLVPQAKVYEIVHGFGLPESKAVTDFVGTSGSALFRDNLDPYQHLEKFFPAFPAN